MIPPGKLPFSTYRGMLAYEHAQRVKHIVANTCWEIGMDELASSEEIWLASKLRRPLCTRFWSRTDVKRAIAAHARHCGRSMVGSKISPDAISMLQAVSLRSKLVKTL